MILSGRLVDDQGAGINGASVSAKVVGNPTPTSTVTTGNHPTTGEAGWWTFTSLPANIYKVETSYQGHTRVLYGLSVSQVNQLVVGAEKILLNSDGSLTALSGKASLVSTGLQLKYASDPLDGSFSNSPQLKLTGAYDSNASGGAVTVTEKSMSWRVTVDSAGVYKLQLRNDSDTEVASFGSDGKLTAPSAVIGGTDVVTLVDNTDGKIAVSRPSTNTMRVALNSIQTAWIADGAVTSAKIADATIADGDLTDSGVVAGSYGGVASIPVITVNAKGRVTGLSTASPAGTYGISITGSAGSAPPTGAAGGSLSGSYPNPGIASGVVGQSQLATGATGEVRYWAGGGLVALPNATYQDLISTTWTAPADGQVFLMGNASVFNNHGSAKANPHARILWNGSPGQYVKHDTAAAYAAGLCPTLVLNVGAGVTYTFKLQAMDNAANGSLQGLGSECLLNLVFQR